jgi:sarcosine oxidase subunit beta
LTNPDVVIAGAGLVGLFTARYLLLEGLSVTVYEAKYPGSGASGSSEGGILLQTKAEKNLLALTKQSLKIYEEISSTFRPDIEFRKKGSLLVAENEAEAGFVQDRIRFFAESGVGTRYFEDSQMRALEPCLGPDVIGASWCPEDASVNPLRLTVALCEEIRSLGGRIMKNNPVQRVFRKRGESLQVVSRCETAFPGFFVNACGSWAGILAARMGGHVPVFPQRGQILVTEPVGPLLQTVLISSSYLFSKHVEQEKNGKRRPGCVLDQTDSGSILVGSSKENKGHQPGVSETVSVQLAGEALRRVPCLAGVRVQRVFSGFRPVSKTGRPIVKVLEGFDNVIVATGHGGDGVALAPIAGKQVTELVLGKSPRNNISNSRG